MQAFVWNAHVMQAFLVSMHQIQQKKPHPSPLKDAPQVLQENNTAGIQQEKGKERKRKAIHGKVFF